MPDITHARQIVFIRTDRLGETLLNLPAVAALKAALPHASVTIVVQPELEPLFLRAPVVERVLTHRPGPRWAWWPRATRLAGILRPAHFDLALVSNPMKELHLGVWLAGIPSRVGYNRKWGRWLLTHSLPDRKGLGERHEVEYNLGLVKALGVPVSSSQWQFPRLAHEQADVLQLLAQQGIKPSEPFIVVHPGTSNPAKRWPVERFQELIGRIAARLTSRVVLIGGPEEQAMARAARPRDVPVADLTGRLTLVQLAALLQCARLLVSSDSGPVHLAAAVKTRTVVLFGTPTAAAGPARWGPWGEGHAVIWKSSMTEIGVDDVMHALEQQLA